VFIHINISNCTAVYNREAFCFVVDDFLLNAFPYKSEQFAMNDEEGSGKVRRVCNSCKSSARKFYLDLVLIMVSHENRMKYSHRCTDQIVSMTYPSSC